MKIVNVDETLYHVSEKEYKLLIEVKREAEALPFGQDLHISEYVYNRTSKWKELGEIDFDLSYCER